jgi:uncharacterized protein YqgC (DUF456 family)
MAEAALEAPNTLSLRRLGAAIGAASGPAAAYAQGWAGTGDGRWHVWVLGIAVGALLGAVTYPLFFTPEHVHKRFGASFAALFGFAVGLVAGAFVAFPMGSVMGACAGAIAGPVVVSIARRTESAWGLPVASTIGAAVALVVTWAWL